MLYILLLSILSASTSLTQQTETLHLKKGDTLNLTQKNNIIYLKDGKNSTDYFKYIWPVVTLLLGIGVNKGIEWLSDRKKTRKLGVRWAAEIRGLHEPINKQISMLNEILNEEKKMTYTPPRLEVIPTLDCDIFKSLDKGEFFKFLQTTKNLKYDIAVKTSNTTHGYITTLEHLHVSLKEKFKEYLTGFSKQVSVLNIDLQLLSKEIGLYGVYLEELGKPVNEQNYPQYFEIYRLMDKSIFSKTDGNIDLFSLHEQLFKPMMQITAQFRRDKQFQPVIEALQNCVNDVKGLKMEKQYWITNIDTITKRYSEQLLYLDDIVKGIDPNHK